MWINKSGAKLQQYNENQRVLFVKHIDNYIILTNRWCRAFRVYEFSFAISSCNPIFSLDTSEFERNSKFSTWSSYEWPFVEIFHDTDQK